MANHYPPLGTIIASILTYDQLTNLLGQQALPLDKRTWAPCDNRDVRNSEFTQITFNVLTPDLRGVFLRGLNQFYPVNEHPLPNWSDVGDPDGQRIVGSFQPDTIVDHTHVYNKFDNHIIQDASDDKDHRKFSLGDSFDIQTSGAQGNHVGTETRPRNRAVYYYIKINSL